MSLADISPDRIRTADPNQKPVAREMLLRDHFAGLAMAADFAMHEAGRPDPKDTAEFAYEMADAMLAARSKP